MVSEIFAKVEPEIIGHFNDIIKFRKRMKPEVTLAMVSFVSCTQPEKRVA